MLDEPHAICSAPNAVACFTSSSFLGAFIHAEAILPVPDLPTPAYAFRSKILPGFLVENNQFKSLTLNFPSQKNFGYKGARERQEKEVVLT